jgi:hypothetical protein
LPFDTLSAEAGYSSAGGGFREFGGGFYITDLRQQNCRRSSATKKVAGIDKRMAGIFKKQDSHAGKRGLLLRGLLFCQITALFCKEIGLGAT